LDNSSEVLWPTRAQCPGVLLSDPSLTPAAVLILLFHNNKGHHLVLTKRSIKVEHHKGEICFPGGKQDPNDSTLLQTALRETHEEIGVRPEDVKLLGALTPTATTSGFAISPFVGQIPYPYYLQVNKKEISEVIEVPLSIFFDPTSLRTKAICTSDKQTTIVSYIYGTHTIWGATARIITELVGLLATDIGKETPWNALKPSIKI
jgi:8-oxo-dGTP pyrophosphatase MutT (NUDIX family)